jgi:3-oxoacyl-[acyl-carrier-protein] synthase-3
MALKLATAQISTNKYKRILVVGADKAYSSRERRFFGTIMGDAVIGMTLENGQGLHEVITTRLDTVLIAPEGENSDARLIQKYRDTLPLLLRDAYKECLSESALESVNYIAPHTPNRGVWDVFAKLTGIDRNLILDDNIGQTGHLNSNDSFYHYFTHCENGTIQSGQSAMLINPGFGGTRGCTILRRN